jgi:dTDP-4-amino-4,6-dideoxygalactose transaminase
MPDLVPFIDLDAQRRRLGRVLDEAIRRVVSHGAYILGPEVQELESRLADFCGVRHAVACGSGTDALALILMAKGVKPGDAVFCPAFTFAATAEVVAWLGAVPVFVDVRESTFNLDAGSLESAVEAARSRGLRPAGVIAVDLFGQPADYDSILPVAAREGLWLLCDAAQSFGATYRGSKVGSIGVATATSFYPSKPLGCYGDGGAVLTNDDELADRARSLRSHGQGSDRYDHVRVGLCSRLDTIQAAILIEKLKIFPDEIEARNELARRYGDALRDVAIVPEVIRGAVSVWAQYTLRKPGLDRGAFQSSLRDAGVPTAVHYAKPLHRQRAYETCPTAPGGLPATERLSREVVSLPMHPYLSAEAQQQVVRAVRSALRAA